jgi:hypothetical protein
MTITASNNNTCWWKRYPKAGNGYPIDEPRPDNLPDPRLPIGTVVRLCAKPEKARKILRIEWHRYRYRYVYVIETSACAFEPYWFIDQLMLDGENQCLQECEPMSLWQQLKHRFSSVFLLVRSKCNLFKLYK